MNTIQPSNPSNRVLKSGDSMTGNLGIGTPNPLELLHIYTTGDYATMRFDAGSGAVGGYFFADNIGTSVVLGSRTVHDVSFVRGGAEKMRLTAAGAQINGTATISDKLAITTGANKSAGTGTLTAGTVAISTTAVTASSLIFLTDTTSSLTNVGVLSVSSKIAGTSFTVTSANVLDTATFNWLIIN